MGLRSTENAHVRDWLIKHWATQEVILTVWWHCVNRGCPRLCNFLFYEKDDVLNDSAFLLSV